MYLVVEVERGVVSHLVDDNAENTANVGLLLLRVYLGHLEHAHVMHAELEHRLGYVVVRVVEETKRERQLLLDALEHELAHIGLFLFLAVLPALEQVVANRVEQFTELE